MEEGVFHQDTSLGNLSSNTMDYEFMDELLSQGCWLEATGGSDFLQSDPSSSPIFSPLSYSWPSSSITYSFQNLNQPEQVEEEKSVILEEDPPSVKLQSENSLDPQSVNKKIDLIPLESSGQSQYYPAAEFSGSCRRWWIGPWENQSSFSSVRERLYQALEYIKSSIGKGDVLIQIWVPVKKGQRNVLITDDQPYSLDPSCQRLVSYRSVSVNYQFAAEENSTISVGLPGRVFLEKVPEWTSDVRFFSSDEYPRVGYAQECDVHGTIAVPIFERGNRSCLGVLEVVTTQKINYLSELENVCRALEAVDLRGSEVADRPQKKVCNESYQAVLPEIIEVLRIVCETHKLPLAQTWVPCTQQGKGGYRHSEENYTHCISTMDSACYVTNSFREFHEACSEHHLSLGQGVAGSAFITNQPCFSSDITAFRKKDYPLIHYARMFELRAAVAIRLRSIYDRTVDYVLEFFLPVNCREINDQMKMLDSLSIIIQRTCRNLRVVTDKELAEENVPLISEVVFPPGEEIIAEEMLKAGPVASRLSSHSSWITNMVETQRKAKVPQEGGESEGFNVTSQWIKAEEEFHNDSNPKSKLSYDVDSSVGECGFSTVAKQVEKKRTKVEKTISLQVLQQHFAGSLKDAAKSIGVCPTTLKRICRQHGIKRWPSRKIKKVGHSLRKLQVVIDSVQGAEGSFKIGSLYANFPELVSPNLSGSSMFATSTEKNCMKPLTTPPEGLTNKSGGDLLSPQPTTSKSQSSSCSRSSNSSLCCSSGNQPHQHAAEVPCSEDVLTEESVDGVLKRSCSDAELHISVKEEMKLPERCRSHKSFTEGLGLENLFPLTKDIVTCDKVALRAKVTYGEEKIRFSMQTMWGFKDVQQEIAKRFHIDDMSIFDIKYLDDDSEWILLTCDADVEECIEVYKSSRSRTIKLSIHPSSQPKFRVSLGSRYPSGS